MKKILVFTLAALALVACKDKKNEVSVESITLDKTNVTVKVGEMVQLTATVKPEGAATVEWESQAPGTATVNNGIVTGVAEGQALVVAKAGGKTASCIVNVSNSGQPGPQPTGNKFKEMLTTGSNFYVFMMGETDYQTIAGKAKDFRSNGDYTDDGKLPEGVTCTLDIWNTDVTDSNFGTPSGLNAFGTNDPSWMFWRSGNLAWGNMCGGVRQWREADFTGIGDDYEFVLIVRTPATQGATSVTLKFYSTTDVEDAHDKACSFNTEGEWKAYSFKMGDLFKEGLDYTKVFTNAGVPGAQGGVLYTPAWVMNGSGLDLEICAIFIYKPAAK